jgi:hypothetical protein
MAEAFLDMYGEDSVFVTATVDSLTWRFVGVLVRADKIPPSFEPTQYGPPEMRQTLDAFLKALAARGLSNPPTVLMRSALGYEQPDAFQIAAGSFLGVSLVANWLHLVELGDYAGATALLAVH